MHVEYETPVPSGKKVVPEMGGVQLTLNGVGVTDPIKVAV
jgi:hypothetical protein